jgi:hypothetical protein
MATTDRCLALASLEGMRTAGVRFALLHGRERLLRGDLSDVDLVVGEDPKSVVRRSWSSWATCGLTPIVVWPYDIGGTATVFLATPDASAGVQLDLLYDRNGVGRYGVKSPPLLASADSSAPLPVVSDSASLIYQWRKRTVKRQTARLKPLEEMANRTDRETLLSTCEAISGSTTAAYQMLEGRSTVGRQWIPSHPEKRAIRLVQRLSEPVGFWAHAGSSAVGAELACRFSRFLPCATTQPTPTLPRQLVWWATTIMPIRLRPGVFVSTGRLPRYRIPDIVLAPSSRAEAARQLTSAMTARLGLPGQRTHPWNAGTDGASDE